MATSRQPGRHQLATTVQPRIIPADNVSVWSTVSIQMPQSMHGHAQSGALLFCCSTGLSYLSWSGHLVQWKAPAQARQLAIKVFTMWPPGPGSRGSLLAEGRVYPIRRILLASWTFLFPIFR
jgi:hypothetical protein